MSDLQTSKQHELEI